MAHCSSTAMRQSSLPILVRSSCGTPNDFVHSSMSFFMGGEGSLPCVPFERNHCAHSGPMFVPPRGLAVVKGNRCVGKVKKCSVPSFCHRCACSSLAETRV